MLRWVHPPVKRGRPGLRKVIMKQKDEVDSTLNRSLEEGLRYTYVGLTMVVLVGVFLYGGYRFDGYFRTSPWGTLSGLGLGVFFGFGYFILEIVRLVQEGQKQNDREDEEQA